MVNKNFRAPGMSKNVCFSNYFANCYLVGPFFGYFDLPNVGRLKGYLLIKFGGNRLVNTNFRAPGV
jgi:hypothetical protein